MRINEAKIVDRAVYGLLASSGNSYHNGGVEGDGLSAWYSQAMPVDFGAAELNNAPRFEFGPKGKGSSGGARGSGGSAGSGTGGSAGSGSGGSGGSGTGGGGGSGGGPPGVLCFCRGTRIMTSNGFENVEDIAPGRLVLTQDGSYQELRLCLRRRITRQDLKRNPKLRPVRISAGAMGHGLPLRDMLVSRQHRLFVSSAIAQRMFGDREALISAIKLTACSGVFVDLQVESAEYFHLVFDDHEVIWAEGLPSESFHTGVQALVTLQDDAREELFTVFPDLAKGEQRQQTACFIPDNLQQKVFVARHVVNNIPLYSPRE